MHRCAQIQLTGEAVVHIRARDVVRTRGLMALGKISNALKEEILIGIVWL